MKDILKRDLEISVYRLINFINLSAAEKEMVRNWRNNEKIRKWMYNDNIITKDEHVNFINFLKNSKDKVYWLVKKEDSNIYVGVLNLVNISWRHRNAYLGIYTNPEQRIRGSGKIILSFILKIAFSFLNLHSLKLEVIENNEPAIRLYRNFGFQKEGKLREFVYKNGEWKDVIVMGLINPLERYKNGNI